MEVLVYYSPPSGTPSNFFCNRLGPCWLKHFMDGSKQFIPAVNNSTARSMRFSSVNHAIKIKSLPENSLSSVEPHGSLVSPVRVSNENCNSYVIDSEEGRREMPKGEKSAAKVLIPGLPDESNGGKGASISSCFWEWKPMLNVHYEKSGCENVDSPPVLFLPGFGVGSFHYENQLKDLGLDFRVWALDFLGQGLSLPNEDPAPLLKEEDHSQVDIWGFGENVEPWAEELAYSIDLWKDQVRYFIEEVVGEPVYIVGNSLGGYVALYFAACHPELVKGVTLLNATPFWGFLPNPTKSPLLAKMFPWAGTFPLPANMKTISESVWQKISDPGSITEVLKQVYADNSTNFDKVFSKILETTKHPAAPAAFTSIMFAPSGQLSFTESLSRCQEYNIPICLMYGKEDPWVKPIWGRQVKRQVPDAPYYEMSPAGHCPHDEVPEVVNYLLRGWIKSVDAKGCVALPLVEDDEESRNVDESKEVEFITEGLKKCVRVRYVGSPLSLWNLLRSGVSVKPK